MGVRIRSRMSRRVKGGWGEGRWGDAVRSGSRCDASSLWEGVEEVKVRSEVGEHRTRNK